MLRRGRAAAMGGAQALVRGSQRNLPADCSQAAVSRPPCTFSRHRPCVSALLTRTPFSSFHPVSNITHHACRRALTFLGCTQLAHTCAWRQGSSASMALPPRTRTLGSSLLHGMRLQLHPGSILPTPHHVEKALVTSALSELARTLPPHLGSRLLARHHVRRA